MAKVKAHYKTVDEITAAFIANGWSDTITFTEATKEETDKSGFFIKQAADNGAKFFIMTGSGNMFDDTGSIVFYNIPVLKDGTPDFELMKEYR